MPAIAASTSRLRLRPLVVRGLLQPALQVPDLLGQRVLLAAQRGERGLGGAAQLVGVEQPVDDGRVLTASALALAHSVGVVTEELEIDHGTEPTAHAAPTARRFATSPRR